MSIELVLFALLACQTLLAIVALIGWVYALHGWRRAIAEWGAANERTRVAIRIASTGIDQRLAETLDEQLRGIL